MIVCPRCSKDNQDHYKFCLGCGAELPKDAAHQPKSFTAPTPPAGFQAQRPSVASAGATPLPPAQFGPQPAAPSFGGAPVQLGVASPPVQSAQAAGFVQQGFGGGSASPVAAAGTARCPKCGHSVPPAFKFCGSCGCPMTDEAAARGAQPSLGVAPAAAPAGRAGRGSLVLIRSDGTEGGSVPLMEPLTAVGRDSGPPFAGDTYLSPRHATLTFKGSQLHVRDEGSLNGVYMRLDRDVPTELQDGAVFRVGQELLKFERLLPAPAGRDSVEVMGSPDPGYAGRLSLVIGRDSTGNAFCIPAAGLHMGRERGDVLFPDDGYVSGLHCRLHSEGGRMVLTDVGSSNGTFVRMKGEVAVKAGSTLLFGQQIFRAEY